jgi:hypothetical protein
LNRNVNSEVALEMLVADAVMGAAEPRLEVA